MTDLARRVAALTPEQIARLKARGTQLGGARIRIPPPVRNPNALPVPTFGQERMWAVEQLDPATARYNVCYSLRLQGKLDVASLTVAIRQVIHRHEPLRTRYVADADGRLKIKITSEPDVAVPFVDLSEYEASVRANMLADALALDASLPFALDRDPTTRQVIFRLAEEDHTLQLTMHHIAIDGWSIEVLVRDLSAFYNAAVAGTAPVLPQLPIAVSDFARWQREVLSGPERDRLLDYWMRELEGSTLTLQLPTDRPRPASQTFRGAVLSCAVPAALEAAIGDFCQRDKVTRFMVILAALYAVLARYTGQNDIVIGSPFAARSLLEVEDLIGFFTNTVLLRGRLSDDPTFLELLRRTKATTLAARDHEELPLQLLMEAINPERDISMAALFQVMLVFQGTPPSDRKFVGLETTLVRRRPDTSLFDLTFDLTATTSGIEGEIEYNTALFDETTIARLWGHVVAYLDRAILAPEQKASSISLLTAAERTQLLSDWNATAREYQSICIHQLFEEQAQRRPDAVAVVDGDQRVTYRDLDGYANQIANHLIRLGAGPDLPVAIYCGRGVQLIAGILGILKSGSAYVPLDPAYPRDRIAHILEDSNAAILLTQQSLAADLPHFIGATVLLDSQQGLIGGESRGNPGVAVGLHHLAYILFTSGSTGRPKGVAIEHRTPSTFVQWANETFTAQELAGVLFSTSVCFDVSMFEIFVTLSAGGRIIVAPNLLHLPTLPARDEVTLVNSVPSAMATLVRVGGIPDSVLTINLAGESVSEDLVEQIYGSTHVSRVNNLYGPTETSYATYAPLPRGGKVSVGRPIANTRLYVLDAQQNPVPIGVAGELYVAGDGIARGYANAEQLTAARFLSDKFGAALKDRIFRTGDMVRYLPDGNLIFLGRSDRQMKLRGYRIEPGEIENVLLEQPEISEAVVVTREDLTGEKQLAAYLVASGPVSEDALRSELRVHLRTRMPDYMVPTAFVFLKEFPTSPNGKTDFKALPLLDLAPPSNDPIERKLPQNDVEQKLLEIWCEVLERESIGTTENFFDIGGNSLSAMRVAARIPRSLGVDFPVTELFQSPTIESLAMAIQEFQIAECSDEELLRLLDEMEAESAPESGTSEVV